VAIDPKSYVPALELDNGKVLTEDPAIVQYQADQKPATALVPPERQLAGRKYLFGDQFTAADAYLFAVTRWAGFTKVDLSDYANLQAFQQRVAARPAVQAAMREEGLIPADKAA